MTVKLGQRSLFTDVIAATVDGVGINLSFATQQAIAEGNVSDDPTAILAHNGDTVVITIRDSDGVKFTLSCDEANEFIAQMRVLTGRR